MAENKTPKIEKPWAVYGWWNGSWDIGILLSLSEDKQTGEIRYIEGQHYSPEYWDMKWVRIFKTSEEAINYFSGSQSFIDDSKFSKKDITKRLLANFPKAMKQESIQNLYETLVSYKNKLSSQSLPKCTGMSEKEKIDYALAQSNIC